MEGSLWSYLQRLAEIEQTGRKPLTIQRERFIDMDKIFSIAPLIDKSFLNISIKKAVPSEDTAFLCDSVAIRTQDPRLRRALLYPAELRNHP